jgi:hypothetical protein
MARGLEDGRDAAALRISAGARLVTETWSSTEDTARGNLQRELGRAGARREDRMVARAYRRSARGRIFPARLIAGMPDDLRSRPLGFH